jgi:hypothetical protein
MTHDESDTNADVQHDESETRADVELVLRCSVMCDQ